MFAGERAAVFEDDVRSLIDELTILRYTRGCLEIEGDAQMNATLTEVAVHGGSITVVFDEEEELAEVLTEEFRGNR